MKIFSSKKISRRSFLKNGFRLSAIAFLGIGYERRNNLKIEHVRLGFPNLPPSFHGFRIIQISDLHASFWVGRDYLMEVVREINKLKKNLVVISGDIITGSVNNFWKRWMPAIKAGTHMVDRLPFRSSRTTFFRSKTHFAIRQG